MINNIIEIHRKSNEHFMNMHLTVFVTDELK